MTTAQILRLARILQLIELLWGASLTRVFEWVEQPDQPTQAGL